MNQPIESPAVEQKKAAFKALGTFGGRFLMGLVACYLAIWANVTYTPGLWWSIAAILILMIYMVPQAIRVLKQFEDAQT